VGQVDNGGMLEEGLMKATFSLQQMLAHLMER
jgi:hypothetical protein